MFKKSMNNSLFLVVIVFLLSSCGSSSGSGSGSDSVTDSDTDPVVVDPNVELVNGSPVTGCAEPMTELSGPFLELAAAPTVDVVLSESGCTVTLESDGKPYHTSAYWDPNGSSGFWVEAEDPDVFGNPDRDNKSGASSPGMVEDYIHDLSLTVSVSPQFDDNPAATHLGDIGIAVSGAPIFDKQEGPVDLGAGVIRGLDRNGAHTGPSTYHYHLEPKAISNDDTNLVGIIGDGFFVYGRKCYSAWDDYPNDYPSDLDSAYGHTSITQHTGDDDEDAIYHYHISNDPYLDNTASYLLFGSGVFSGIETPFN